MLKVGVAKTKSLKGLVIKLLKVIAVPSAAVITEDAQVLACELLVKVGCVLNKINYLWLFLNKSNISLLDL